MKKQYDAPTLFCDEFAPDTMIASSNCTLSGGSYCDGGCQYYECGHNGQVNTAGEECVDWCDE